MAEAVGTIPTASKAVPIHDDASKEACLRASRDISSTLISTEPSTS